MRVLGICGSLRVESSNLWMLRAAARLVPPDMEFVLYEEVGELPHFNPDRDAEGSVVPRAVATWRDAVTAADGVVISSPEYAHGVPGSLKNALDWLVSTPAMFEKPLVLINAAPAGGAYAQKSLAETLRTMGANVLEASLLAPFVTRRADDVLEASAADAVGACMDALAWAIRSR